VRRRELISLIGGAAAWPLAAQAQQPAKPVIGFLRSASLANAGPLVTAFRQGLKEAGYVEGRNVIIEFRSAEGRNDELPKLVAELLRLPVAVIVCNVTAASAAMTITSRVPIVFATGDDPVAEGLATRICSACWWRCRRLAANGARTAEFPPSWRIDGNRTN
jgi:putative ABC transport system substrate-binding protein